MRSKSSKKICLLLLIPLVFLLLWTGQKLFAGHQTVHHEKPYDFQLPAGTTDISLYQIPEKDLQHLSTGSLIETILSNSFLMQFEAFDSSKTALEVHMSGFNIYPALFQREDCEKVLLDYYDNARILTDSGDTKPEEYFRVQNLEILLAARLAQNSEQGIPEDEETKERLTTIHQEKENERHAADASNAPSDGFVWFEENYY